MALTPERISALSWQSRDALSRAPESLQALPQAWDDTERLLGIGSDFILFDSGEGSSSKAFLAKAGIKSAGLIWGEDFASVHQNMDVLGEALGAQDNARRQVVALQTRLAHLERHKPAQSPKVLYLARSGGSAGPGTLVDAAIKAAGGENVITEAGWGTPEPEFILSLQPDLIITSYFSGGYESVNATALRNAAVRGFIDRHQTLHIPGDVWPCAGPNLIEAAEMIQAKVLKMDGIN